MFLQRDGSDGCEHDAGSDGFDTFVTFCCDEHLFLWNRISVHNSALLFYFVEVYFGLYFAAVDVPPSSSSQALATTP